MFGSFYYGSNIGSAVYSKIFEKIEFSSALEPRVWKGIKDLQQLDRGFWTLKEVKTKEWSSGAYDEEMAWEGIEKF